MSAAEQIRAALDELGVPDENYPAPVANAVGHLHEALAALESLEARLADKVWLTRDEAIQIQNSMRKRAAFDDDLAAAYALLDERPK